MRLITNSDTPLTAAHAVLGYQTTRWQRRLYDKRLRASSKLRGAVNGLASAIVAAHPSYDHEAADGLRGFARDTADVFAGEVFARLYGEPEPAEGVGCPYFVRTAHEGLEDALAPIRVRSAGDPDLSALGAVRLIDAVAKQVKVLIDEERDLDEAGEPTDDGLPSAAELVRASARGAAALAAHEVSEVVVAMAAFGHGLEAAPAAHEQEDTRRMQLADLLAANPAVRSVLRRAGRITRVADAKQRERSPDARSEVVSIERGADLSRVLPSELVGLNHPLLRKIALRSIIEESCLQYELAGDEPLGRGPMVLLVDRSTSMRGAPHQTASAAAIAAVVRCARDKRACTIIGFNGGIESVLRVDERGEAATADFHRYSGDINSWAPMGSAVEVVMTIARSHPAGGTDFNRPLSMAARNVVEQERADVLFITDGQATASEETLEALAEARAERGLRVFGMTVNGGSVGSAVAAVCDEVIDLDAAGDTDRAVAGALA